MDRDQWVKRFRAMTLALIFSGALNIGLIAAFIFSVLQKREAGLPVTVSGIEKVPVAAGSATIQQEFKQMSLKSFRELVSFLTNQGPVEAGYLKRDLALGALVSLHHFNLEKALSVLPQQRRLVALGDGKTAELFPALTEDQFEAIVRFAYEEKWPLTAEGLFTLLKKWPDKQDPTLVQSFLVTPEFRAFHLLFQKTEPPQNAQVLVQLICEGDWEMFDRFVREGQQRVDLSIDPRRALLLGYLSLRSPTAAHLLLTTDFSFVADKMDDRGVIDLIGLLGSKTFEGEKLCVHILRSPRSDAVWQAAAQCLYRFVGEPLPTPFDLQAAIGRFVPESIPAPPPVVIVPSYREHIVKEGENLWKIARQYKVKVDEIAKLNELEQDRLHPGMILRIP